MDETQTRLMLEALRKMADAPDGRIRTYGPDRPHLKTLEALVARGLARWVAAVEGGGTPAHAEITDAGRRVLADPARLESLAETDATPELDPSQGAPGARP
jgi:hypothetical protein